MSTKPSNNELNNLNSNTHQLVINRMTRTSFKAVRVGLPGFSFVPTVLDVPNQEFYIPGMRFRADPVIVQYIVDEDMSNYMECLRWISETRSYDESELLENLLSDFTVNLLDNHHKSSVSFRYTGGFIQGMDSLDVDSRTSNPTALVNTLTLRFQNVEVDVYNGDNKETIEGLRV
ncbi:tail completion and sheath stabilizer protein [Rhizobium phage RHph_I46]|uniref:Tail completion and sheath stabilizer protein n=1 Tax=Rhizobium phage RHph_I1_9 TaxID=2509729 RepID=A0A7S5UYF3_9CAUD|nr:tail tube [Rhizobium phage RHph_I1_9]QIG69593.1 tail completion and sheath stabilizer protein [Rhizobium phage RHph_I46]QIG70874.1 tail completion and sheath stabilizer protein [Rhizobium phage RHph_I9]QIG73461.1 tail completion and sheath stabilizer protein [Rhizobium phage RHph_I1_9]QIG76213.1 tail completion and sheath stabilizer protein [Rhizobium phage RHph_I34]